MKTEKDCVVGLGYIGLPTALMFAEHDLDVIGLEIDELLVRDIRDGEP